MTEEEKLRKALEDLLCSLGWATLPDNPDGLFITAQLLILRRSIRNAYKALGFTDEELKGYLFDRGSWNHISREHGREHIVCSDCGKVLTPADIRKLDTPKPISEWDHEHGFKRTDAYVCCGMVRMADPVTDKQYAYPIPL